MPRYVNLANYPSVQAINITSDPGLKPGKVVVPNAMRVVLKWTLTDGKTANVVLGAAIPSNYVITPTIALTLFNALFGSATYTSLKPFLATTAIASGLSLRDLREKDLAFVDAPSPAATPGTGTGGALPDEVAAVVTLKTQKTGPGHRGRAYIPGWAGSAIGANGVILAGAVTALQNWANTWSAVWAGQGITLALVLPERLGYTAANGTVHDPRPAGTESVTQTLVRNNTWDTQRRRGLK